MADYATIFAESLKNYKTINSPDKTLQIYTDFFLLLLKK